LALYSMSTGDAQRLNQLRWMETYFSPGGPGAQSWRNRGALSSYGPLVPILYFMMFDPNVPAATDTRSSLPTDFAAPGIGRLLSRTSWNPNASWFTYLLSWNCVDHQPGDGN